MTAKTDYHVHTSFSSDARAPMEDMITAAIRAGISDMAFTDHVDFMPDGAPFPHQIKYTQYIRHFEPLREKYAKKIHLTFGVEFGLREKVVNQCKTMLSQFDYEFVIASAHDIHAKDVYLHQHKLFTEMTREEVYEAYLLEVWSNVRLFKDYDTCGHMDYVVRYAPYDDITFVYESHADLIDSILKTLIQDGKALELNMAGFRFPGRQVHPMEGVLKRYKELGGELLTIGSDSHKTERLGVFNEKAADLLRASGFKAHTVYHNRKPIFLDL